MFIDVHYLLDLLPDCLLFEHLVAVEEFIFIDFTFAGDVIDVFESACQRPSLGVWNVQEILIWIKLVKILCLEIIIMTVIRVI